jgi:hypothetical protein
MPNGVQLGPSEQEIVGPHIFRRHQPGVVQAGGKVLGEPLEIPGVGRYVSFFDTEGNRVSMMQPNVT